MAGEKLKATGLTLRELFRFRSERAEELAVVHHTLIGHLLTDLANEDLLIKRGIELSMGPAERKHLEAELDEPGGVDKLLARIEQVRRRG